MRLPPYAIVIILIVFGFLVGSTTYFYNKSRTVQVSANRTASVAFNGQIPEQQATQLDKNLADLTKPAEPKGRLTYPTNVYVVQPKDSLFSIGTKFGLTGDLVALANGITNQNVVQADAPLVIPAVDHSSDYYRVNFTLNSDKATQLNQDLRSATSDGSFDPVKVAQKSAVPYFGVSPQDSFTIGEEKLEQGTATVLVKSGDQLKAVVGLFQPKTKGEKGFWGVLYVEYRGQ